MKKRTFLLLFVSLSVMQSANPQTYSYNHKTPEVIVPSKTKAVAIKKKELKKELKRRKKLHKSLLSVYNKGFETVYLKLIENNSHKISALKQQISHT